ncbi:MAG: type II toxin-antitoxin system RelB/DinJ family antitoxin [Cytophagales bacterium]|nr:type II toxin-antitoxin system RelB/DinJ family antitoxin [Cytophagales bacterium]
MTVATASRPSMYQFRIDEKEKSETFAILENLGMKPSQAVRLFFRQIRQTKSIPFPIEHIPNEKTAKALLLPDSEKGYQRFDNVEALFADLNDK